MDRKGHLVIGHGHTHESILASRFFFMVLLYSNLLKLYDSQRHLVAVSKYAHVQTCECLVSCRQNVCFRYTVQTETYSAVTSRNTYIYTTTSCGWWGWSRCDTTRSVNIFQKKNILLKLMSFCLRQKGYIK